MAPSYRATPLVLHDCVVEKRWVVLFGARPSDVSLVPGEIVPEAYDALHHFLSVKELSLENVHQD